MRFRKSIKIMKGLRLNFSKSGLSLTAGVPGASVNFGPRGTSLNTGIPGTGLYDRTRIGGTSSQSAGRTYSSASRPQVTQLAITVGIEDDGSYFIRNQDGSLITDESVLRKIKRTEAYKAKILELGEKFVNDKADENQAFIDIYKLSPPLTSENSIREELDHLKPVVYSRRHYGANPPEKEALRVELEADATRNIRSFAFWTLKKRREEFVNSQLPIAFEEAMERYKSEREEFITTENETEREKNQEYLDTFNEQRSELHSCLAGEQKWVEQNIETFLSTMTLPVDFSVAYEYDEETGWLTVDLDLPEVEDLPTTKATALSTGKVKVKEKSQKEIKEEYLRCISGLAFFFASCLFNISTHISSILISGFTQRLNKKTGKIGDEYVYSIILDRAGVSAIEVNNIDPVAAFEGFPHRRNVSKTFEVNTIVPFAGFHEKT